MLYESADMQRPFTAAANPAHIDAERRHPSAEEQERIADRFDRDDGETTPEQLEQLLHPPMWRRFARFWRGVLMAPLRGSSS